MRLALLALCLLGGVSAHGQSPVWAIHGAHNTVYLAESVHLLKADQAALPAPFERAYADATTIVMEIDLSRIDAAQIQSWTQAHAMLPQGTTLEQSVGPAIFQRAADAAQHVGMSIEMLQTFAPWMVALTLADLEYLKLGYDPQEGVEEQIERRAARDGKPILGLETLDQQLGQLVRLSPDEQSRFLDLTVEEMKDAESDTDELVAAWRAGDNAKLASLLSSEYQTFPELYAALVTERNRNWLPQIRGFLSEDHNYLVVVGALHLVGTGGLIDLARQSGLVVTPVLAPARVSSAAPY